MSYWYRLSASDYRMVLQKLAKNNVKCTSEKISIDASGFRSTRSDLWRHIKWGKQSMSRSSKEYHKVHIAVCNKSRAVVAYALTPSNCHDSRVFLMLWRQLKYWQKDFSKLKKLVKVYLDKAYWSKKSCKQFSDQVQCRLSLVR